MNEFARKMKLRRGEEIENENEWTRFDHVRGELSDAYEEIRQLATLKGLRPPDRIHSINGRGGLTKEVFFMEWDPPRVTLVANPLGEFWFDKEKSNVWDILMQGIWRARRADDLEFLVRTLKDVV